MVVYSIKELESASGIRAHTIRMWEKRYNLLNPKRNKVNQRVYTEADLKKLVQISYLLKSGHKISKVACLPDDQIEHMTADVQNIGYDFDTRSEMIMLAIMDLDEIRFKKIFAASAREKGIEFALEGLIFPILGRMNFMIITGALKKVHEHFIIHHTRSMIMQEIDKLKRITSKYCSCILLYQIKDGFEDLTTTYLQYLASESCVKIINIGSKASLEDLMDASAICKPDYLLTFYNPILNSQNFEEFVQQFASIPRNISILIYTPPNFSPPVALENNFKLLNGLEDFQAFLTNLKTKPA